MITFYLLTNFTVIPSSSSHKDTLIFEHYMNLKCVIFTESIRKTIRIIIIARRYI